MADGFGSYGNPYVEFPFDRVVEVHWKTALASWAIDFVYQLPVPPGTLEPTQPTISLQDYSGTPPGLTLPIRLPSTGTWTASLQIGGNAPGHGGVPDTDNAIAVSAQLVAGGSPILTTPQLLKANEIVPSTQFINSGPMAATGQLLDLQVFGTGGGPVGGNILAPYSILALRYQPPTRE
jgi:hypothetical protein